MPAGFSSLDPFCRAGDAQNDKARFLKQDKDSARHSAARSDPSDTAREEVPSEIFGVTARFAGPVPPRIIRSSSFRTMPRELNCHGQAGKFSMSLKFRTIMGRFEKAGIS